MSNNNQNLSAKGVSLTPSQWERCDRLTERYGKKSRNLFIREAVDFYCVWLEKEHMERFLLPSLESVMDSKIKDSEGRIRNVEFKMATQIAELTLLLAEYLNYSDEDLDRLRADAINLTDGSLRIAREVVPAGGKIVIQPPKTKNSIRTVVLPPYMVAILAEMKKSKTCEWIFPSPVKQGEPRNPTAIHRRFKLILERSGCKNIRFHDLRHTFATMALENGMNVKVLSDMIGHISAETTLNIYSHVTDTMRTQASVKIDRKIGGTDAPMPEAKVEPRIEETSAVDENFEPWQPKYRKPGTGCVYQINDSLWEGSFYPRLADGNRKKFNVYAKTREECEEALAKMIAEKKAEIAAEKAKMKTA